jgi:erythromycin esterase-like protein
MIQTESEIISKRKTEFSDTRDLLPLAEKFKDKKVVMLGEASHGTHQYYNRRARLTRILMSEYDFNFMAVEGDWPPCYELNRHVKNYSDAEEKTFDVLQQFDRSDAPNAIPAGAEKKKQAESLGDYSKLCTPAYP